MDKRFYIVYGCIAFLFVDILMLLALTYRWWTTPIEQNLSNLMMLLIVVAIVGICVVIDALHDIGSDEPNGD